MSSVVRIEIPFLCEAFVAVAALEGTFSSVDSGVYIKDSFPCEAFVTVATCKGTIHVDDLYETRYSSM